MSIEKIIESLAMALTHSEQGEYAKNEEFVRTSLEEYRREVIDKCVEALPPLSTDHEWNWSEGYNQYYLEAHKKLNNLK